ncbi:hypothetical protein [Butyrivibrio sp. YAB3001]|uniref:hypothetical protein n=1 Tax=Butyrivibrio sp. YAB3001 TaxID=1520812 RepID=UPI0008F61FF1|nr:hypothetical protein [Butyrivibrio sp. YAB3001]SFC12835.1 hypothetical protein SAMN02910398_01592 [Butyrivibrio sp. YAB3001]
MIIVAGNNISALFLCAYFEQKGIDYIRYYTENIDDYTFYLNDVTSGMEKRALELLGRSLDSSGDKEIGVYTDGGIKYIPGDFKNFCNWIKESDDSDETKNVLAAISEIGKEWIETVENTFNIKTSMDSIMARNFMKGYSDFLTKNIKNDEIKTIFKSFVPRRDVSLNTAAGYIYSQLFDGSGHENKISELAKELISSLSENKQIKLNSFEELDLEGKDYEAFIKLYEDADPLVKLTTYYVESDEDAKEKVVFCAFDDMEQSGISQMILWSEEGSRRLDVYYESSRSDDEVTEYVRKKLSEIHIKKQVGYTELKRQYGSGHFAGWAFNTKENCKNPIVLKNKKLMDLSHWGNGHFTCCLVALANLER